MIKFSAILTIEKALKAVESDGDALQYVPAELRTEAVALKAVERNGDALRYVLNLGLFIKIASKLGIKTDQVG